MIADVEVHAATKADLDAFLGHVRPEDEAVCRKRIGFGGDEVAAFLFGRSKVVFAAFSRGVPAALFGVVEGAPGMGTPWLLRTPEADRRPLTMAKAGRRFLPRLREACPVLVDAPFVGDVVVRRWLSWLGFQQGEEFGGRVLMTHRGDHGD